MTERWKKSWPKNLPAPNEVREYKVDGSPLRPCKASQTELIWIEYEPRYGPYGFADLCYWPNESRENHDGTRGGDPVRLSFRCRRDAREWYAWNVKDELCAHCFTDYRAEGEKFCRHCREAIDHLDELEQKHKRMTNYHNNTHVVYERIRALEKLLEDGDFTTDDKAAVLDRIISELPNDDGDLDL